MRAGIKRLQQELGNTSIFVTHALLEALTMADRMALISDGKLAAFGTPDALYERPKPRFVAELIGNQSMNFLDAEIVRHHGRVVMRTASVPAGQRGRVSRPDIRPRQTAPVRSVQR